MEIPLHFFPAEIRRRLRTCWDLFVEDLDLRFQESRKRRLIELALDSPEQDLPIKSQIEEFNAQDGRISILDWIVLFEWNERWQQVRTRLRVHQATTDSDYRSKSGTSRAIRTVLQRLTEIESKIRFRPLSENPPLLELLLFRWRFSSLRNEADYLVDRLKQIASRG